VIIDSPVGPHHGADVSAPVFQRISQQVLEYLHTPHDIELPPNRQVLLAARQVNEQDIAEGSPDHLGAPLDVADDNAPIQTSAPAMPPSANPVPVKNGGVVQASLQESEPNPPVAPDPRASASPRPPAAESETANDRGQRTSGTVVLDVEQGGILVPSFIGKTVRTAIETAEESGLDLDAVGSGMAREQSPSPGTHVQTGTRVTVKFER
jgi:cell division protein FtsI (penicillin-binding protein 3)